MTYNISLKIPIETENCKNETLYILKSNQIEVLEIKKIIDGFHGNLETSQKELLKRKIN